MKPKTKFIDYLGSKANESGDHFADILSKLSYQACDSGLPVVVVAQSPHKGDDTVWFVNAKTGAVHEEARANGRPWGHEIIGPFEDAKEAQTWFAELTLRMETLRAYRENRPPMLPLEEDKP